MPWDEALRLTRILVRDPASQVCAALSGWQGPYSVEAFILADLFDLAHQRWSKGKPKPRKRPTDPAPKRLGAPGQSQHKVMAALRSRGHGRGEA